MVLQRLTKPKLLFYIPLLVILVLAVACGSSAEPAPTTAPPTTAAVVPTTAPVSTTAPPDDAMAALKTAPSFAEYWNPPTDAYGEPVYGNTLRVAYEDPLDHANSWGAATGTTDRFRSPTMNVLIQENPYDPAGELIPDLARSWTIHDDSQGVTFRFPETKWHNGADFSCEDARFSYQTMTSGEGLTSSYMKGRLGHVDQSSLECEDDLTLTMRFNAPSPTPLLALSNRRAYIFNKAWFEAGGEDVMFQDASVGTGAFTWDEGQEVGIDEQRFSKNPNYFISELPYVDNLVIFGIEDESAQQAALLAHQVDWHWVRNFGQYDAYVAHDQIRTIIRATRGHLELWVNPRNPPFDNVRVRQAIIMGIDRAAGIQVLQQGFGSPGFIMAPGSAWELTQEQGCAVPGWCFAADMDARREEAIAILKEEGFDFDQTYLFTVESDAQVQARAVFVQEQLRLMGVKTDFDLLETIALREQEQSGTWGALMPSNATMQADDPSVGMGGYHRCAASSNQAFYPDLACDTFLDGLFEQLDSTTDVTARKKISDEAQLYIMNQYWKLPVYWEQEAVGFWPEVRGYVHFPAPFGSWVKYQHVWVDPSHKDDKGYKGQKSGLPGGI